MARSLLSMRWEDLLFAHWAVDPDVLAPTLPGPLTLDTHDGDAYLSVVGFRLASIRPRGLPAAFGVTFPELNLRTYVRSGEGPGVYFYNLDAADPLGVLLARGLFRLPYYRAEVRLLDEADGSVRVRSRRTSRDAPLARFDATYRPRGDPEPTAPDSLAAFLAERYRFYTASERGRCYVGRVEHPRWNVGPADLDVRENTLFAASGFEHPPGEPLVHYSPGVDVTAGRIRRVR